MRLTKNISFYFILTFILNLEAFLIFDDKKIQSNSKLNNTFLLDHNVKIIPLNRGPIPESFNWIRYGAVSPVKDQGTCSACWAFSIAACVESQLKIHLNQEEVISEQHLIDCVVPDCGCSNCSILNVWGRIVSKFGGVVRYQDYRPYNQRRQNCEKEKVDSPVPVIGFRRVLPDENVMTEYVYKHGPLVVAINSASMTKYPNNITVIDNPPAEECPPDHLDHSVLIVGYDMYTPEDSNTGIPYWIIKNSWGKDWGDYGFYYLVRGRNACGLATDVSFGFVK